MQTFRYSIGTPSGWTMLRGLPALSFVAGAAAFGAAGAVLALMGAGVPFLLAAAIAAVCAGLLIYGLGRTLAKPDPDPALSTALDLETRVHLLEESSAHLRHDLRGVLSPALMMADRLLRNEDPAIRRAGQAVVRSVERATTLIVENKKRSLAAVGKSEAAASEPAPQSQPAETGAPAVGSGAHPP